MLLRTLLLIVIALHLPPGRKILAQQDPKVFTSGTEVIFLDSLKGETPGEFPRKWDLIRGAAENATIDGTAVITSSRAITKISPLLDRKTYLPADGWTLECRLFLPAKSSYCHFTFRNQKVRIPLRVATDRLGFNGTRHPFSNGRKQGWHQLAISYNQGNFRVFLDGERFLNVPQLEIVPEYFEVELYTPQKELDAGAMPGLTYVRLARAELPLYERLVTKGKLVFSNIIFATGKATLTATSSPIVDQIAALLREHPDLEVSIEGHTDDVGNPADNLLLSEARAVTVVKALTKRGIESGRLRARGHGESQPIADNGTPEGKASNRRVEIIRR